MQGDETGWHGMSRRGTDGKGVKVVRLVSVARVAGDSETAHGTFLNGGELTHGDVERCVASLGF